MKAPPIQYATTRDGVRIAYYTRGEGPPLVNVQVIWSHLTAELELQGAEPAWQKLASRLSTVVRFDPRGFGLSDRSASDFSLEGMCLDVEAVVTRLGLGRFNVTTQGPHASLIALAYAARHQEQIRRMALVGAVARIPRLWHDRIAQILKSFPGDWLSATEAITLYTRGWEHNEEAKATASLARASIQMPAFERIWREIGEWDVSTVLSSITTPTLLVYQRDDPTFGPEHGREMASVMPNSQVVVSEKLTAKDEVPPFQEAIVSFFGAALPSAAPVERAAVPSGTAIILFADIVDSTAQQEQLGNAAFRERSRALEERVRERIAAHAGSAVDGRTLGDGVLATFASASDAIAAALACAKMGEDIGLALHLGLHAGDVMREGGNVHGQAVSIASRVSDLSAPNEVLVSGTVRDLARASAGVMFEDRGERELKGVGEPVRVWAVR